MYIIINNLLLFFYFSYVYISVKIFMLFIDFPNFIIYRIYTDKTFKLIYYYVNVLCTCNHLTN